MNILDQIGFEQHKEVYSIIGVIIGILILSTVIFYILGRLYPGEQTTELKRRTRSWWIMATIFITATVVHPIISFIAFGLLSFVALRELASISTNMRNEDRGVIIWCYLAIPVQYYLAYIGWFNLFIIFIPVLMFIWIPFILVVRGYTTRISSSMSILPTQLMFTVFSISHLAYLLSLPEIPNFNAGGRGLLLYVVFLTEMNDVFQFIWGKLFGRHKIIEKVSPNKTWGGVIGGLVSTIFMAYFLRFLTPFTAMESWLVGAIVGFAGFIGDIIVSAVKRDIGIKDTGSAIPGHGGILDRVDSLAITAPVFFYLVYNLHYA